MSGMRSPSIVRNEYSVSSPGVGVPPASATEVLTALTELDADVRVCPRLPGDAAGDPCVLRFREAVANGAIAFGVQGTENAWCLDGGRTIGWEMTEEMGPLLDRIFIQVGGGATMKSNSICM